MLSLTNQDRSVMRNNESGFIPIYLHFLPQVVNFNNKGTNHGPHDPKKEQDKSPQNNQQCHFRGHPVSPSSKLELKFSKKTQNRNQVFFKRHKTIYCSKIHRVQNIVD